MMRIDEAVTFYCEEAKRGRSVVAVLPILILSQIDLGGDILINFDEVPPSMRYRFDDKRRKIRYCVT